MKFNNKISNSKKIKFKSSVQEKIKHTLLINQTNLNYQPLYKFNNVYVKLNEIKLIQIFINNYFKNNLIKQMIKLKICVT